MMPSLAMAGPVAAPPMSRGQDRFGPARPRRAKRALARRIAGASPLVGSSGTCCSRPSGTDELVPCFAAQ
jgi:hypothetical protein